MTNDQRKAFDSFDAPLEALDELEFLQPNPGIDETKLTGYGRTALIRHVHILQARITQLENELKGYTAGYEDSLLVIARLEKQITDSLVISGWWCECGIFNGAEKEVLNACRSCDKAKPNFDL